MYSWIPCSSLRVALLIPRPLQALVIPVVDLLASRPRHTGKGSLPTVAATLAPLRRGRSAGARRLSRLRGGLGLLWNIAGSGLRLGVARAVLGRELAEELPRVAGRKGRAAAGVLLRRVVVAVKDDPRRGLVLLAARVLRLGRATALAGLGLGAEGPAAVVLHEAVAHLPALLDA